MTDSLDARTGTATGVGEKLLIETFEICYDKVFRYFLYHIHNNEHAQDLTGEVFCRVAAAWSTYDPNKGAASTWVFSVAKNLLRDSWRKKVPIQVELMDIAVGSDLEERAENMEQKELLCQALGVLSKRERELIGLRYLADLSTAEIAVLTGLSPNNIRVILFRSVKKLQHAINKLDPVS